jgi:hypothetical protein
MKRAPVRQIAEAVERQGGDLDDVRDLVLCWERMHGRLRQANELYLAGDAAGAEKLWRELELAYGKPLDELPRMRKRRAA